MAEIKVSEMTELTSAPDNAKFYVVIPDNTTPYFITKENILKGQPYTNFQFKRKGYGNAGAIGEAGDIYEGWVSEGVYCTFAVYDGSGDKDLPASFNLVTITEI